MLATFFALVKDLVLSVFSSMNISFIRGSELNMGFLFGTFRNLVADIRNYYKEGGICYGSFETNNPQIYGLSFL